MADPKNPSHGQEGREDPVAGPPTGHGSTSGMAQKTQQASQMTGTGAQSQSQECTPEALRSEGCSEELAREIPKAVGAGISWMAIIAALAQRLGPVAVDVIRDLINSFSMGRRGGATGTGGAQTQSGSPQGKKDHP